MMTLVRLLPFLIGECVEYDEHWESYLLLVTICDMCCTLEYSGLTDPPVQPMTVPFNNLLIDSYVPVLTTVFPFLFVILRIRVVKTVPDSGTITIVALGPDTLQKAKPVLVVQVSTTLSPLGPDTLQKAKPVLIVQVSTTLSPLGPDTLQKAKPVLIVQVSTTLSPLGPDTLQKAKLVLVVQVSTTLSPGQTGVYGGDDFTNSAAEAASIRLRKNRIIIFLLDYACAVYIPYLINLWGKGKML